MNDNELKLTILAKLSTGMSTREVSEELDIAYPKVLKYKNELKEAQVNGDVQSIVNVDELIVHRVAEEVKQELLTLGDEDLAIVDKTLAKIDAYQVLSTKLQTTALAITSKITHILDNDQIGASTLESLADTLTKIQIAFFNKSTTNVNVLQQNTHNNTFNQFKSKP